MKWMTVTTAILLSALMGLSLAPTIAGTTDPPAVEAEQPMPPQDIAQTTFLGVETLPLRPHIRRSLEIKAGTALAIRHVGPGTPAAEAGLMPGDVLVKLNEQLIINGQQLAVLVRTFAPGDVVSLHVLRDGEPVELRATLAGRAAKQNSVVPRVPGQPMPNLGDLDALFDQLRGPGVDPFMPGGDVRDMFDQMQRRMFEQRDEMQRMMDQMRDRLGNHGVKSSISFNDGEHHLQLRSDGQDPHLTVKSADGEVLFDGPLPEDGQVEGLPADVQNKIDGLLKHNRIEFRVPKAQPREPLPVA